MAVRRSIISPPTRAVIAWYNGGMQDTNPEMNRYVEPQLRPAQVDVLNYEGGRMAVSAVPGSGKTFTLSRLAAKLIATGKIDVDAGQQVLVVTYLNASVETFKARIRQQLQAMTLPYLGYDVRTLHSLGLEIARIAGGELGDEFLVLDEVQADYYLNRAVNTWIDNNAATWHSFLPDDDTLQMRTRWRTVTERTAKTFIRSAKNERLPAEQVYVRLQREVAALHKRLDDENVLDLDPATASDVPDYRLLFMLNGIYDIYQSILTRQGAMDFDDLIWRAARLLEANPDLAQTLSHRWPFVLEDEAQDSVPLQEALLSALTEPTGNWVRVGDPNQAITSSFTAAHPRYFNEYLDRSDVEARPLPDSGRSAPRIIGVANALVHWVAEHHPVPEVRRHAFRVQDILPTPPGDAQPNPPDTPHNIRIKVYDHREQRELPAVARLASRYVRARPEETVAILAPTNRVGHAMSDQLDRVDVDYDNLLRGGSREREIASAVHAILALLADPLNTRALVDAHRALLELKHPALSTPRTLREPGPQYLIPDLQPGWPEPPPADASAAEDQPPDDLAPADLGNFYAILRSVRRPELLLFPTADESFVEALPEGVATEEDVARLRIYLGFLRQIFSLRHLSPDDLAVALSNELFTYPQEQDGARDGDLSIAYQIASMIRRWRDLQPGWRLPEIVTQLDEVASGRRPLPAVTPEDVGFEPAPGRVTLATQHSAKGLEWDAVFLIGIDGFWIPDDLRAPFLGVHDFLGGDPAAEATAQLRRLMFGSAGLFERRDATETAHIEVISERLRLLYVGITRARRYLHISRSRVTRYYQREREAAATRALGVIYDYLQEEKADGDDGDY